METVIATVTETNGDVFVRAFDGTLRVAKPGDVLFVGEIVITENGANAVLDFGNNEQVQLGANQELALPENILAGSETFAGDSVVIDPSVEAVLAALEGDGDLLDDLEAPAAGVEGAPDGGGASFVQLTRIVETVDPLAFQFDQEFLSPFEVPIGEQDGDVEEPVDPIDPVDPGSVDPIDPIDPGPVDPTDPIVLLPPRLELSGSRGLFAGGTELITAPGMIDLSNFEQGSFYNPDWDLLDSGVDEQVIPVSLIELELGLNPGTLSSFDANVTDAFGVLQPFEGKFSSMIVGLTEGSTVAFDWTFFNGESIQQQVDFGQNDFVVLVITGPNGDKELHVIASSDSVSLEKVTSDMFSKAITESGNYRFDWVILDGVDAIKDSGLRVSAPKVTLDGISFYSLPIDLNIAVSSENPSLVGEELFVKLSSVPAGSRFNVDVEPNEDGEWLFALDQLDGLQWLPPLGFSGQHEFVVSAISKLGDQEVESQLSSIVVTLDIVDNIVSDATPRDDAEILGTEGNDLIHGYAGDDVIIGGAGNDIMFGGLGADTFVWKLGHEGEVNTPAFDIVGDFTLGQFGNETSPNADRLDLSELLDFDSGAGSIEDIIGFISIVHAESGSTLNISHSGNGEVTQQIVMHNVDLRDLGDSDLEILTKLISDGNLIVE